MKIILFLGASFAFISANSQQLNIDKNFDGYFKVQEPGTREPKQNFNSNHATWKLISENAQGKVWESPIDKMHCLTFNFNSKMPVTGQETHSGLSHSPSIPMPNPMLHSLVIPPALNLETPPSLK
jgi:hypothetical protein